MGMTRIELFDLAEKQNFPHLAFTDTPLSTGTLKIDGVREHWAYSLIRANEVDLHRIHAALLTETARKKRESSAGIHTMRRFLLEEVDRSEPNSLLDRITTLAEGVVFGGGGVLRDGQGKSYAWVAVHWLGEHGSGVTWDHFESFMESSVTQHTTPTRQRRIVWLD